MARRRRRSRSRRKGKLRKFFRKLGRGKVAKFLKKVGKGYVKAASFLPLLPFRIAMRMILKKKGIKPERKLSKLAQQFYNVIIKKRESYEVYALENISGNIVAAIVKAVINYFRDLKKKKERGEKLPPGEDKALQVAEKTVGQVVEVGKEEARSEITQKSFTPLLIISALALVLVFAFVFAGKKGK